MRGRAGCPLASRGKPLFGAAFFLKIRRRRSEKGAPILRGKYFSCDSFSAPLDPAHGVVDAKPSMLELLGSAVALSLAW